MPAAREAQQKRGANEQDSHFPFQEFIPH